MEAEALATAFQRSLEDASVRAQGWDCEVCTFVNAADRKGSLRHCGIAFSTLHSTTLSLSGLIQIAKCVVLSFPTGRDPRPHRCQHRIRTLGDRHMRWVPIPGTLYRQWRAIWSALSCALKSW